MQDELDPDTSNNATAAAFIGHLPRARLGEVMRYDSWADFRAQTVAPARSGRAWTDITHAVHGFFLNGGTRCYVVALEEPNDLTGALATLAEQDDIGIVAAPGRTDAASYAALVDHCEARRDRVAILDGPARASAAALKVMAGTTDDARGWRMPPRAPRGFGTLYTPWIRVADPEAPGGGTVLVPPAGHIAGAWVRNDATHGVWRAPANLQLVGALSLERAIPDAEQGAMNANGVNVLRLFPARGVLVWGARTLSTDPEFRYVNVRRLLTMISRSLSRGLAWTAFEPNGDALWARARTEAEQYLFGLWRVGALPATTPDRAYFIRCDRSTMTQDDIDAGRLVMMVGVAAVRPGEFTIIRIECLAGRCGEN